ncbi:nucleotidyl transferase AbiEii/AbiGii toxin family protein [Mycoplasma sp. NEAQ87857]|uniref:nucleotidyl transferase AbiEii/AbiGii toxin family protein n=1 Tax=Mycoplasma sp. NEAQ87857 TaxID=2683967 RepID=UPI001319018F|nr:nucleotidyl transferase AbiEii/AbiGii toxin family protein [Mycoplasma sp. NEAQ87857]QGZ97316.1 nucleotidyl transferase AbiEii/AbiGii toxin family protein [Mycoplasma sp. NEAQ87857]
MNKILKLSNKELKQLIQNAALRLHISTAYIEKDIWICFILKYLFNDFKYKDRIVFKGGTCLSKVYKLINRFSEDIDIALDWTLMGYGKDEPYDHRSKRQQEMFNDRLNNDTQTFIREEMLPIIKNDLSKMLKGKKYKLYIDPKDGHTIRFEYPKNFTHNSITQYIRLEIGCIVEPIPSSKHQIDTYIAQVFPEEFSDDIKVVAMDSLRNFYEKLTILHKEANRINGNWPSRYSRHYYDVYKMIQTDLREKSFENLDLLASVIKFNNKFYTCNWDHIDQMLEGKMKLIPPTDGIQAFRENYLLTEHMLFGEIMTFDEILNSLAEYQEEFNNSIKNK